MGTSRESLALVVIPATSFRKVKRAGDSLSAPFCTFFCIAKVEGTFLGMEMNLGIHSKLCLQMEKGRFKNCQLEEAEH